MDGLNGPPGHGGCEKAEPREVMLPEMRCMNVRLKPSTLWLGRDSSRKERVLTAPGVGGSLAHGFRFVYKESRDKSHGSLSVQGLRKRV